MSFKGLRSPLLALALLVSLGACVQSSGRYGIDVEPVTATATHLRTVVGEAVTVTLKGGLGLRQASELAAVSFFDVTLGACFQEGTPATATGGFCGGGDTPLQPWLLVGNADHLAIWEEVHADRGETRALEVSFTFTVSEAKVVTITPWIAFDTTIVGGARGGEPVAIVFE